MLPTNTTANTNVTPGPLQQLASYFQKAGITPTTQGQSAAPLAELPQNQAPQLPAQQPAQPQKQGMLANFPGLEDSLGMGTQQSWDGQNPQTSNLEGILNMLKGTTINGADQVTAQPSFLNSIYRMMP